MFKGTQTRLPRIGEVCLQFLSTQNFRHQQNGAIFKQNDHFQTHCAWNRATRGI